MPVCTPEAVLQVACNELRSRITLRIFRAHFGAAPEVVASIWNRIEPPEGSTLKHLLWAFAFLKLYETEDAAATRFSTTPKTWRKWVWEVLASIQEIKKTVVSFLLLAADGWPLL